MRIALLLVALMIAPPMLCAQKGSKCYEQGRSNVEQRACKSFDPASPRGKGLGGTSTRTCMVNPEGKYLYVRALGVGKASTQQSASEIAPPKTKTEQLGGLMGSRIKAMKKETAMPDKATMAPMNGEQPVRLMMKEYGIALCRCTLNLFEIEKAFPIAENWNQLQNID